MPEVVEIDIALNDIGRLYPAHASMSLAKRVQRELSQLNSGGRTAQAP